MPASQQTTCLKCGATMLESTAARTGGLCMACKEGHRKSPEPAKPEKEREPDTMSEPEEPLEWTEICELFVLAALGWLLGLWVFKGLDMPLMIGTGLFPIAYIGTGC